ncbi:2-hydroxyacid dehydrogenase [Sphingomonas sp. MMS24-J13]|uniref:2-hydroxyacid dehydrogenase n=1 Tax=Sphingomonas sp. MMS24-J13 TaxID=3238686 RepID=UPI00384D759F
MSSSPRPRVLATRRWPDAAEQRLDAHFDVVRNDSDVPLSRADLAQAMREFDALAPTITDRIDAEMIEQPDRRVQIIGSFGVGFEHIDVAAAKRAGVVVTNTPGVLTDATADIALTLLLMAARRAGEGERELRAGKWTGWRPTHMLGQALKGKTLGLVALGRIGQATAERAHHGFGMKIAYYARREAPAEVAGPLDATWYPDLAGLLAVSDFVSLHIPGGAETRHFMNAAAFDQMQSHAILINTARGDVVDEAALVAALREGKIAGAALDVYQGEPNVSPDLIALDNVVLLPHLGSATTETRNAMGFKVIDNLIAWFGGETPPNRIA